MASDIDPAKVAVLRENGYRSHKMGYVNQQTLKVFSIEVLDQISAAELRRRITAPNTSNDWQFFCTEEPSNSIKERFIASLD